MIQLIYLVVTYAVWAAIFAAIILMLVRLLMGYMDVNPFSSSALMMRRLSDPLVNPVRGALLRFGADPKYAPLIVILLAILLGWFAMRLAGDTLGTIANVMLALQLRAFVAAVGFFLYGLLSIYSLLIFIRIIFSWGLVSYANPIMRFLVRATDPLLVPLRRIVPPLGMMDISPIVAFILIWLFQAAIAGTLLSGFKGQPLG
ncbi:MAG TPA: YggT family protein [Pyrinomonadaceae bacterium]